MKLNTTISRGKINCARYWQDEELKHEIKNGDVIYWLIPEDETEGTRPMGYCKKHYENIKNGVLV